MTSSDVLKKFLTAGEIEDAIRTVLAFSRNSGSKVALIGGIAMQFYGSDRLTKDIDFIADKPFAGLHDSSQMSIGGFKGKTARETQVDVIIGHEYDALYKEALREADKKIAKELKVAIARPEHILVMKIVAGRSKDKEDIKTLIRLKAIDLLKTRKIIERHLGRFQVKWFNSLVDEVAWLEERDRTGQK
jgi:Nucleotidyltransferase of unknown function (DUF6036)